MKNYLKRNKQIELEANHFAMAILMPKFLIEQEIKNLNIKTIDIKAINDLSIKFDVSIELMTFRLAQLELLNAFNIS